MTPNEYQALIRAARTAALAVDVPVAREIRQAVLAYAVRLEQLVAQTARDGRWTRRYRRQLAIQARELAANLQAALQDATLRGVRLSANTLAELVDASTVRFIVENAPDYYVPPPDIRAAGAYAARITAQTPSVAAAFRTLAGHVENGADQVDYILQRAILERADPTALARRLRGYVAGSERFGTHVIEVKDKAGKVIGRKIDLRKLPADQRDAARRMTYNAERIAITEMHNAAHEATVQAMKAAPMVDAVTWTLAKDRGKTDIPDECDVLALTDYYGLGPGNYPVEAVPAKPHPFDRCYTIPVIRDFEDWTKPKPQGTYNPAADATVLGDRGTDARQARAIKNAKSAVELAV